MDKRQRSVVTGAALIEKLEQQHSSQTKYRHRCISLVIRMPVAINQSFDVAADSVVNGSYEYLRQLRYFCDGDGKCYLKSCTVDST